jgi:signal transduction histidine kinase
LVSRNQLAAPVTLLALFLLLSGILLATVGWLGWRLLEQDRALDVQRNRERLDDAATLATRELDRSLAAWNDLLTPAAQEESVALPADTVLVVFDSGGLVQRRGVRLPYYPKTSVPSDVPATLFVDAEVQEFRDQDLSKAAVSYRAIAASKDPSVRAAALMRLARVLRKQQKPREAFAVYGELAALGETPVAGWPAELVGRRERIVMLDATGRDEAVQEKQLLASALFDGRFRIDRATFNFYQESLSTSYAPQTSRPTLELARVVEELWPRWQQQAAGRTSWTIGESAFVAVWRGTPAGTAALIGRLDDLMTSTHTVLRNLDVRLALEDPSGRLSWGSPVADADRVTRTSRETNLPWTIHAALADPGATQAISISRRNVFAAGFTVMLLAVTAAGYVVFRAVRRELDVARLQSDFVAAVSHEFRTPLTAMCHLTEMLEEGATPPDRLPLYYGALGRESRRLHAIVESLLDFGRIDAGRRGYQFLDTDAAELVDQVVRECRDRASSSAHRIEWHTPSGRPLEPICIRADREALALALRNLLDNASKYSPESSTVRVSVRAHGAFVGISVEDEGVGIPKDEHRAIFRKFARGSSARALNVKGTGIGLTMAEQIVKAHGGRLELESEPGRGTRFTALIPVPPSNA